MRLPLPASLLVALALVAPSPPAPPARTLWTGPAGSTVYAAPSSHAAVQAILPTNQPLRVDVAGATWGRTVPDRGPHTLRSTSPGEGAMRRASILSPPRRLVQRLIVALALAGTVGGAAALAAPGQPSRQRAGNLQLPPGFRVNVFAEGLGYVRMMAFSPRGDLVATSSSRRITSTLTALTKEPPALNWDENSAALPVTAFVFCCALTL